jgi:hypothetical protein
MSPFTQTMFAPLSDRRSFKVFLNQNIVAVNIASFLLVLVMVGAYIVQVNSSVTKGYQMRNLENTIQELTLQNEKMEVAIREAQSLQNVKRSMQMIGFVQAGAPQYTSSATPAMALAQ